MKITRFIIVFLILFVCFMIAENSKKANLEDKTVNNATEAVTNAPTEMVTEAPAKTEPVTSQPSVEETTAVEPSTTEEITTEEVTTEMQPLNEDEVSLFDQIVLNGKVNTFAMKVGSITDNIGQYHPSVRKIDCSDKKITFYLGGNYTTLKFNLFYSSEQTDLVAGRLLNIIADGDTIKSCKMEKVVLPTEYVVDVSGVQQLTLSAEYYNYTFRQTSMYEKEVYTDMFTLIK